MFKNSYVVDTECVEKHVESLLDSSEMSSCVNRTDFLPSLVNYFQSIELPEDYDPTVAEQQIRQHASEEEIEDARAAIVAMILIGMCSQKGMDVKEMYEMWKQG